jgi:hypothetical protein
MIIYYKDQPVNVVQYNRRCLTSILTHEHTVWADCRVAGGVRCAVECQNTAICDTQAGRRPDTLRLDLLWLSLVSVRDSDNKSPVLAV